MEETAEQVPAMEPLYLGISLDHQLREALTEQIKERYLSTSSATD